MLAALLYDLDGTIVNTDPLHYQAWQEVLKDCGREIDQLFYRTRMSGRLNPQIVKELLPELSPLEVEQFSNRKESRFRELATCLTPTPGLLDVIAWADKSGLKQAVVTNAPRQNAEFMLAALNLRTVFEQVAIAENVGIAKPNPGIYEHLLQIFGITPTQALAFEDSPSGILAAVGAGIPTVGIASTQPPNELYALGATLVIADFTDKQLWKLLQMVANG